MNDFHGPPSRATIETEEARVRDHAIAYFREGLFDVLVRLKGHSVGNWRVISLYAIGGVGVLFRVARGNRFALMKMPHLPYDRPTQFAAADVEDRRRASAWEAKVLATNAGSIFPECLDHFEARNPLLGDRAADIAANEKYIVMEFVEGRPPDVEIQARLRAGGIAEVNYGLSTWIKPLLSLLVALKNKSPALYYTDFKPSNILIEKDGRLRLLDAGSVQRNTTQSPPIVSEGYGLHGQHTGDCGDTDLERVSVTALGRTLYASLCNKILHAESQVDFDALKPVCSDEWARWVERVSTGDWCTLQALMTHLPEQK